MNMRINDINSWNNLVDISQKLSMDAASLRVAYRLASTRNRHVDFKSVANIISVLDSATLELERILLLISE